jgi:drug/metabolite transporter (DMT)-like permease
MKKAAINIGSQMMIFYRQIIVIVFLILTSFLVIEDINLDPKYIVLGIIFAAFSYFGLYFFSRGAEEGDVGIVAPISSGRIIISTFIGVLFLNDSMTLLQFIAIGVIFLGVVLVAIDFDKLRTNSLDLKSGVGYALLAALFWGVFLPLFGIPASEIGPFFFSIMLESVVFISNFLFMIIQKKNADFKISDFKENALGLILIAVFSALASLFTNIGYSKGEETIVSAVSGASPLVTVVFGWIFYKERLKPIHYAAAVLIVVGIIALPIFRSK